MMMQATSLEPRLRIARALRRVCCPQAAYNQMPHQLLLQSTSEIIQDEVFVAHLKPDPFGGWKPTANAVDTRSKSETLYLADSETDELNLPLDPLV